MIQNLMFPLTKRVKEIENELNETSNSLINEEGKRVLNEMDFKHLKKELEEIQTVARRLTEKEGINDLYKYTHSIFSDIDECIKVINDKQTTSVSTTEIMKEQTNSIKPIKWNNDVKLLAYLFWKLREENLIEIEHLGLTLSQIFINSEIKEIKNTTFNKYFSDFGNNNSFPVNAIEIEKIIKQ